MTPPPDPSSADAMLPDRWYTDTEPSPTYPLWSRANAGEIYPSAVTPLAGTSVFFGAGELGWRDCNHRIGVLWPDEWDPISNNIIGCFGGYFFINMSITRIFGVRAPGMTPEMVDQQYFGDLGDIPSYADEARPGDEREDSTAKIGAWIATEAFGRESLPELLDQRREAEALVASRGDLTAASHGELLARFRGQDDLFRRLFEQHIVNSSAIGLGLGVVTGVCEAIGRPDLPMTLVAGAGDVDSAAPSHALWELSRHVRESHKLTEAFDDGVEGVLDRLRHLGTVDVVAFVAEVDAFLDRYGSRGPNEWELAAEVWGTRPEIAMAAVERMRHQDDDSTPEAAAAEMSAKRDVALHDVRTALAGADEETRQQFEAGLRCAQVYATGRERSKTTCILVIHELRLVARELGRRAVAAGAFDDASQVFMLLNDELDALADDPGQYADVVRERAAQYAMLATLEPPFVFNGNPPPLSEWARRSDPNDAIVNPGDVLTGIPGCSGVYRGRARVLLDAADPMALEPGDVLVAPVTDPAWTPLFVPAGAVVVDVGAQITHAVIVSRELAIPCVVSVTNATRTIPDGAIIEVDGAAGTVTIIELPS